MPILVEPEPGWAKHLANSLLPGHHAFVITSQVTVEARLAALELRDTLLILYVGPSVRFAFLLRKAPAGPFIDQALVHGVMGLNIGKCRVGWGEDKPTQDEWNVKGSTGAVGANGYAGQFNEAHKRAYAEGKILVPSGRWPPNVLLVHGPKCTRSGTRQVPSGVAHRIHSGGKNFGSDTAKPALADMTYADPSGLETINAWACQAGCPVALLDQQTGERPSTLTGRADPGVRHANPGDNHGNSLFGGGNSNVYADTGGASRFYPQFSNEIELLAWLARLIDF